MAQGGLTRAGRLLMLIAGLALVGYGLHRYGLFQRRPASAPGATAATARPGATVKVTLVYGTEKERWLKAAVEEFA